ncbi:MAG: helix-turn-helix domain-containing protein [Phycisphaeraceae bacterium]|nr:helix-turn-helix domain-containing protein [Phycisphaeraceae bacterium]MBX3408225.1 helix-turn-helix domain-containing protein [Phycisphaeraceae bacterium]
MPREVQSSNDRSFKAARLHSVRQTADALATSQRTIWRLLGQGELEKVQVGRSVRITSESLDAFIARGGAK